MKCAFTGEKGNGAYKTNELWRKDLKHGPFPTIIFCIFRHKNNKNLSFFRH